MIVPSQLALETHTNFGCAGSLATLDKLVDRFPLPPVSPPIGDTSLTHVMRLAAPTATAGQSLIMTQLNINLRRHNHMILRAFLAMTNRQKSYIFCLLTTEG
jgi:hypothetical protein